MGAAASHPAVPETVAPLHHIAIGGLTGLTHGSERSVTWSFYNESGYHVLHLEHDGLTGRRAITFDHHVIEKKKYFYALFDTSSTHAFYIQTKQSIPVKEAQTMLATALSTNQAHANDPDYVPYIKPSDAFVVSAVCEKDTYFLYTAQVNGLQYRHYQAAFWDRAVQFTVPRLSMTSRRNRSSEDGIKECDHCIVIIHRPDLIVLVDGQPIEQTNASFTDNDGFEFTFELETNLSATYRLNPYNSPQVAFNKSHQHPKGIKFEKNAGVFRYELRVAESVVEPMYRPTLLPASWSLEARGAKPAKDEREKALAKAKAEEECKTNDDPNPLLAAAKDLASKQRNVAQIDFGKV